MEPKVGTSLTLEPISTDRVEKYRCKVVDREGNIIYIDYPINTITRKTAFLVDGAQFRASFMTEDMVNYAFNTEILGRKKNNIPTIMLLCPPEEEFIKVQRREFVRVQTPTDVAVEYKNSFYQYVTEDISAGGMAILLKTTPAFKDGDSIQLTIVLPFINGDIRYVKTDANVVRIFNKGEMKFASVQFTDTDDIDKQYIVRYCFERQLLNRKKEGF